ncbi:MAG: hypothetical protein WBA13_11425 [Microcoleaceae cyanobacterium]
MESICEFVALLKYQIEMGGSSSEEEFQVTKGIDENLLRDGLTFWDMVALLAIIPNQQQSLALWEISLVQKTQPSRLIYCT